MSMYIEGFSTHTWLSLRPGDMLNVPRKYPVMLHETDDLSVGFGDRLGSGFFLVLAITREPSHHGLVVRRVYVMPFNETSVLYKRTVETGVQ